MRAATDVPVAAAILARVSPGFTVEVPPANWVRLLRPPAGPKLPRSAGCLRAPRRARQHAQGLLKVALWLMLQRAL